MHRNLRAFIVLALAVAAIFVCRAYAGESCCAVCKRHVPCHKVCRLVCEDHKLDTICWGCKCEDFCVLGPSTPGCEHCEEACASCEPRNPKAVFARPKVVVWTDWMPGSATIYTKKKLMKKVVTRNVPGYKFVVEDMCAECAAAAEKASVPPKSEVAPLPKAVK